jgi:hypothetical protein
VAVSGSPARSPEDFCRIEIMPAQSSALFVAFVDGTKKLTERAK